MLVCFDSNVYEYIINCKKEPHLDKTDNINIKFIRFLIESKHIKPFITEQTLCDELIKKKNRLQKITNYHPTCEQPKTKETWITENNETSVFINTNLGIKQNKEKLPSFDDNKIANEYYNQALQLGWKILYAPHYLYGRSNHDIEYENYLEPLCYNTQQTRAHEGLKRINDVVNIDETKKNNKLIAEHSEHCDRDNIASCYSYGITYFCSYDEGGKLGNKSIMHNKHREKIWNYMGIKILSPLDLIKALDLNTEEQNNIYGLKMNQLIK